MKKAKRDFDAEFDAYRLERPDHFIIRIAQYLSYQYPNAKKIIQDMQR